MLDKKDLEDNPIENLGKDIMFDGDIVFNNHQDFAVVSYYDNLKQAILVRLQTSLGENPLHPNYGCELNTLKGAKHDNNTLALAKLYVREALLQEPRIDEIRNIETYYQVIDNNTVLIIEIDVKPIEDLEPMNLVYSLFI